MFVCSAGNSHTVNIEIGGVGVATLKVGVRRGGEGEGEDRKSVV